MSKSLKKLIDINRLREFKNKLVGTGSAYVQTGAVDQTIAGTKTFSKPIVGSVTGSSGSCTGNAATATTATTATNATYTNWLRTSSHSDHLFHTEWDGAYFWTYVTTGDGDYRAVRVARSDSAATANACTGNAATATKLAAKRTIALSGAATGTATGFDGSGNITIPVTSLDASKLTGTASVSTTGNAATATTATTATNATNSNAANQLQAFVNDDFTSGNHYVKAIRSSQGWSTHLWMCYNNGAKMADEVSVNYANSAGSANTANSATTATYANWLRTSSHSDHLFHTEWDGAYFWTYVTAGDGGYRAVRVARSDSAANADHATSADSATRATSADRASAVNCVQTSAYHEIRFDWDSQVSGHVGLRVDETDIGGIVTTNRLVSDIRAQWYAAYPDGAEAHNAMWGGRDITAAFNNGTVSANIANGTFRDIFPGDYITKQVTISGTAYTVNWVIADCDYWINKGDTAMTAHHVVIVPQAPIFNANMNATNTTEGGYAGSRMYRETIPACATGIVNAFGSSHILTFRDGITNSVDTSHVSSGITQWTGTPGWWGEWVSVQCNLMSEKMVYGAPICAAGAMDNSIATRQMSAFRLSERLTNYNRQHWWLRDVVSSANFAFVVGDGDAAMGGASFVLGVRPFALLK